MLSLFSSTSISNSWVDYYFLTNSCPMFSPFIKKSTSILITVTMLFSYIIPYKDLFAAVNDWASENFITSSDANISNSWSFDFVASFSWSLDNWDTIFVDITDSGSVNTLSYSWIYNWSWAISYHFDGVDLTSLDEWRINFSWSVVNSWWIVTASWITEFMWIYKDTVVPDITDTWAFLTFPIWWEYLSWTTNVTYNTWLVNETTTPINLHYRIDYSNNWWATWTWLADNVWSNSYSLDTMTLADTASWRIRVYVIDWAGNTSAKYSESSNFIIDNTTPSVSMISGWIVTLTNSWSFDLAWTSSESLDAVRYDFSWSTTASLWIYPPVWNEFSWSINLSSFADWDIDYSFYAIDLSGNRSTTHTWFVTKQTVIWWSITTASGSFLLFTGSLELSWLNIGTNYWIYSWSTLVSSGILTASSSTWTIVLNPSSFHNTGLYTLTLSWSNSTYGLSDSNLDSKTYEIGDINYAILYNQIWTSLNSSWIINNFTWVTNVNVTSYTWLYFEKPQYWKILFSSWLDLTNSWTITFLQSLPTYLDMSDWYINFNAWTSAFDSYWANLIMYFDSWSSFVTQYNDPSKISVKSQTWVVYNSSWVLSNVLWACQVWGSCTVIFDTSHFTSFELKPILTTVNITSNNASWSLAKIWDTVTLSFTWTKTLSWVSATIWWQTATITWSTNHWFASRVMSGSDSIGDIAFNIDYRDLNNNSWVTVTWVTDSSSVFFQKNSPQVELTYSPATLTWWSVVAIISWTWSNPAVSFSWSSSHTFTNNWSYTFYYSDSAWNMDSTGATVTWIDNVWPVITGKTVRNITQTWANIAFNFTDSNFSSWVGYVIAYTGWIVSNLAWTWVLSLPFAAWVGSWSATFSTLLWSTNYDYLINLTDNIGNSSSSTWGFTTIGTPIALTGWISTQTWSVSLTWATMLTWATLDLSGTILTITSDSNDSSFISGSLSISGTNITVTWSSSWNWILIPPTVIDNSASDSATWSEIWTWITVTQTIRVGAEWASIIPSTSSWYFSVSFAVPGYSSGTVLDLYRSNDWTTWTRVSPDWSCTLDVNSMCNFRTDHLSLFAPVLDSTPDSFSFTAVTNAELSTDYTSSIIVAGINTGSTISIASWLYKIGAGAYTGSTWVVNNWDTVTVKLTSSSSYSTNLNSTLTIWWVSAIYSVATKAAQQVNSGWWGWWSWPVRDYCPSWDTTSSYYDGKCWITATLTWTTSQLPANIINDTKTNTTQTTPQNNGVIKLPQFPDTDKTFARNDIVSLVRMWVVKGYSDWTFKPENFTTRGEFLAMVFKALDVPVSNTTVTRFSDIPSWDSWMIKYIEKAKDMWIINGQMIDGKLVFRPNDSITRAEAMAMLLNTAKISVNNNTTTNFTDIPEWGHWMIKYIEKAKELGIAKWQMLDWKLKFRPSDPITRAETARVIMKTLSLPK